MASARCKKRSNYPVPSLRQTTDPVESLISTSGCLTIIVVQHSTQPPAALDRSDATDVRLFLNDEPVGQPLVVTFAVIMHNEFVNRLPQLAFSE